VDAVDDDSALVHHSGRDCRPGGMGGRNTLTRRWFEMTVLSTERVDATRTRDTERRPTDTFAVAAPRCERHLLKE
jgi:hypothetical protein